MKRSTPKDSGKKVSIVFDPIVECAWLPDREVKLSEYNKMVTHFVQNFNKEKPDAVELCVKKFTDRQKPNTKDL